MKIRFLCLNLHQGGNLFEEILAFIKQEKFDILALQEVYDGHEPHFPKNYRTMEMFTELLPEFPYTHFSPAFLELQETGNIVQGNAVFSKFPILSANTIFYDVPYCERVELVENFPVTPRNLEHIELDLGETNLHVFNTQGIWGTDGRDSERRLQMADTLVKNIKDKKNFILCGDFNMNPDTQAMKKVERFGKNIFGDTVKSTFNMRIKTNPAFATAVVDMIYVSPSISVLEKHCLDIDLSDHLPLVAQFEIL